MIRDDIKAAQVTAMKTGDKEARAAIGLIQAAIKNRDIELRTAAAPADDDAVVIEVLQKMVKQRRESIQMYETGGRQELADAERAEVAVIERFLPAQMSEDDTRAAINEAATRLARAAQTLAKDLQAKGQAAADEAVRGVKDHPIAATTAHSTPAPAVTNKNVMSAPAKDFVSGTDSDTPPLASFTATACGASHTHTNVASTPTISTKIVPSNAVQRSAISTIGRFGGVGICRCEAYGSEPYGAGRGPGYAPVHDPFGDSLPGGVSQPCRGGGIGSASLTSPP